MSITELQAACTQYKELQRLAEEVAAEMEAVKAAIRAAMGGAAEIVAGPYKVTDKAVNASRVDTKALKAELPDVAARYTVQTVQQRFSIK